ncbi:MAG: radical SAM protein [Candidatus Aminicenantes bacterium]|jgi:coproporphyrinogen III oxidase-like Fe-S oxidoreductase
MKDKTEKMTHLLKQVFAIENNWKNVFYVHTPFCLQRCNYCVYSSRVPTGREELDTFYRRLLPAQLEQYKPLLARKTFDQVYFGGGTPTIIDADTLETVYKQIPNFKAVPIKATEISPYTVTNEHIDLFHRWDFIYVSMGVQTFNERVLRKENRLVVTVEKLTDICRQLDKRNTISNVDLIFYLDTGHLQDLVISRSDLEILMSLVKPVSITLHCNYRLTKSLEKRKAMVKLIVEMLEKYPEYRCVNSLLEESEMEFDTKNSAEYRLMKKQEDFNFYMLPKVANTYPYGHNILSIGEYMEVKPWSNYYYIYTLRDRYMWKEYLRQAKTVCSDFEKAREKLGLPHHKFTKNGDFFTSEEGKEKFKRILKQTGNPYYEFNREAKTGNVSREPEKFRKNPSINIDFDLDL